MLDKQIFLENLVSKLMWHLSYSKDEVKNCIYEGKENKKKSNWPSKMMIFLCKHYEKINKIIITALSDFIMCILGILYNF